MRHFAGIGTDPFQFAVNPVAPPFASSAFARPAPDPTLFTDVPKRLAGPVFPAPGWHVGPAVSVSGYGAFGAEDEKKEGLSNGVKIGLAVTAVLALGALFLGGSAIKNALKPKARKNPKRRKNASVTRQGKTKQVKNLGWLLRNAQDVKSFEFRRAGSGGGGLMIAHLDDGGKFESDFADYAVFKDRFVDRPVFRGLPLKVVDASGHASHTTVGAKSNPKRRNNAKRQKSVKQAGVFSVGDEVRHKAHPADKGKIIDFDTDVYSGETIARVQFANGIRQSAPLHLLYFARPVFDAAGNSR